MERVFSWHYGNPEGEIPLEEMFALRFQFNVLVQNQTELDLFKGYELMFGRELFIDVFSHWKCRRAASMSMAVSAPTYGSGPAPRVLRLLPWVFTTWPDANLRGL